MSIVARMYSLSIKTKRRIFCINKEIKKVARKKTTRNKETGLFFGSVYKFQSKQMLNYFRMTVRKRPSLEKEVEKTLPRQMLKHHKFCVMHPNLLLCPLFLEYAP